MNYSLTIKKILSKNKGISDKYFSLLCADEAIQKYINSLCRKFSYKFDDDSYAICLVSLWKSTLTFDKKKGTFPPYFYRIAKQDIIDQFRKNKSKLSTKTISMEDEGVKIVVENLIDDVNYMDKMIKKEEEINLYNYLNKNLNSLERDVMWSHLSSNARQKEIAKDMNKKITTISYVMQGAKKKLKKIL